jgi:hypothetical protein
MTTLKRTLLATSLAAAGLMGASLAQAADPDVSTIYGRGSPPNAHITATGPNFHAASDSSRQARMSDTESTYQEPVRQAETDVNADSRTAPTPAAAAGEYITTPTTTAAATDTIVTPSGSYLEVDEATRPQRHEMAVIHEESIDGVPLVDGRGVREGYDLHAGNTVQSDAAFDVSEVLGRASPPAPEMAPGYGLHS